MSEKKILILGSGLVAKPCVEYLLRNEKNKLTIGIPFYIHSKSIPEVTNTPD